MADDGDPIEGPALLLAAAKASVAPARLPDLVGRAAATLRDRRGEYERDHERVDLPGDRTAYLVPTGHWETVGSAAGLDPRETDAVRRAHRQQLLRDARALDRRGELETALEIREAVVVGGN